MNLFGEEVIRTIGLYQPFASLMHHGKIETRWVKKGKKAPFPLGKYLIYSTKKEYSLDDVKLISGDQYNRIHAIGLRDDSFFITGKALSVGDLVTVFDLYEGIEDRTFVQYKNNNNYRLVGLLFKNVVRVSPFDFKGKQGVGFYKGDRKLLTEWTQ